MKRILIATTLALLPTVSAAQVTELPAYAYDAIAEIGYATTAGTQCVGAKVNDRNVQKAMQDVLGQLASDGIDPIGAVQHLETDAGLGQIQSREVAFRSKHKVGKAGYEALCAAIKAETKENKAFGKLVRVR